MEIHLAPETEAGLQNVAFRQGKILPQVVEETVTHAWELLREEDLWLATHKNEIHEQIQVGLAELDRGEGIPDYELDAALVRLKSQSE